MLKADTQTPRPLRDIDGFLLTREWRDTALGLQLSYWFSTAEGPLLLLVTEQQAVCFIESRQHVPVDANRRTVALKTLNHQAVDALYFQRQSQLDQFSKYCNTHQITLYESDVKAVDRYLMERFITGAATIRGDIHRRDKYIQVNNAKLRSCNYEPILQCLSLDIETDYRSGEILSIGASCIDSKQQNPQTNHVFIVSTDPQLSDQNITIHHCVDEITLLGNFFSWFSLTDPDLVIGWNVIGFDLMHIQKRCEHYSIPFNLGRGGFPARILPASEFSSQAIARIPGRAVLDGIETLRAAFWQFEHFSLDFVASELLQQGKLIQSSGKQRAQEILDSYHQHPLQFIRYNSQDCKLVLQIFFRTDLFNFCIQRCKVTGLALGRNGGSVAAFDFLYLPRLHRKGYVAENAKPQSAGGLSSPGGYVLDSKPGLYNDVLVLDFKSLYPSIIRSFFIDPLGLAINSENKLDGFDGARFDRNTNILPTLIDSLWRNRDLAKADGNKPLSQALKIIMNSFYGVMGTSACRFYDPRLTSSITRRGHEIILSTQQYLQDRGFEVIYGDTDSLFIWLQNAPDRDQAREIGRSLTQQLNNWWQHKLATEFSIECYLELEFETHYLQFLMPTIRGTNTGTKKRYAGTVMKDNGDVELVFKGLEAVRSDWTPLAKDFQQELYSRIFRQQAYQTFCQDLVLRLYDGELDHLLVYRKRIRRPLDSYQKNVPPHIQAARKSSTDPGRWIEYVITTAGPQPRSELTAPPDYDHYRDKQLRPVADSILHFLGHKFDDIISGQLEIF